MGKCSFPSVWMPEARIAAAVYASLTRAALRSKAPDALRVTAVARWRAAGDSIDARAARTQSVSQYELGLVLRVLADAREALRLGSPYGVFAGKNLRFSVA